MIAPFYRRLYDAVRAVDADHILFFEGNRYSVDFDMFGDAFTEHGLHGPRLRAIRVDRRRRLSRREPRALRLGVDAWGSTDRGIRDILDPIEATFRREFPGFDPLPFGQRWWIHGLVRHILLAEPLVEDFGRCFEGVSRDEIDALADSFRFQACRARERLVETLRTACA